MQTYHPYQQLHSCLQCLRYALLSGMIDTLSHLWHDNFYLGEMLTGTGFVS